MTSATASVRPLLPVPVQGLLCLLLELQLLHRCFQRQQLSLSLAVRVLHLHAAASHWCKLLGSRFDLGNYF